MVRPNGPPGAGHGSGSQRVVTTGSRTQITPRQARREAAPSLPPGTVARLLALSDERDRWLRRVLDSWREGYRAAHAPGYPDGAGYRAGYNLGFDTGYSARQDSRAFVRGVVDGFEAGTGERKRLVRLLREARLLRHPFRLPGDPGGRHG